MLKKILKAQLSLLILLLSGCAITPQDLGISEQQWKKYDQSKREQLLSDYKTLQKTNELNDDSLKEQYQSLKNNTYSGNYLRVRIYDGEALMPPFTDWYRYNATTFDIIPNSCTNTLLEQGSDNSDDIKISLRACYMNNVLFLDPKRYTSKDGLGTVRFAYSPLWGQGFTYRNINSNGYVKLKDVSVSIKEKNN